MRHAAAVTLTLLALAGVAAADPAPVPTIPTQVASPMRCESAGGTVLELPADFWLVPPTVRVAEDAEMRRLQGEETRLTAENASLRSSVRSTVAGARLWVVTSVLVGFSAGYAYARWGR